MIFRTGSVLIVGMCDEYVLQDIYHFLKSLLKTEFKSICQKIIAPGDLANKDKKKKIRRKTIHIVTGTPSDNNNLANSNPVNTNNTVVTDTDKDSQFIVSHSEKPKKIRKQRKTKKNVQLEIIEES